MKLNCELSGNLSFISFGDLLQLFGSAANTGILRLSNPYSKSSGIVYINNGNPTDAEYGELKGLDALYSFFGWDDGTFEFTDTPVFREVVITKGRMEIILEGLRLLDDNELPVAGPVTIETIEEKNGVPEHKMPVVKGPLVDYMYVVNEEEYAPGTEIVTEGKHGNWIWVILDGTVDVLKESDAGSVKIMRLKNGAFIGSAASYFKRENRRNATVRARSRVSLGVLDSQLLGKDFSRFSFEMRSLVNGIDSRLVKLTEFYAKLKTQGLSGSELPEGLTPVLSIDGFSDRPCIIKKGSAYLAYPSETGDISIMQLGPGEIIGLFPVLRAGLDTLSDNIYVTGDFEFLVLETGYLSEEYSGLPLTLRNLLDNLTVCVSVTGNQTIDLIQNLKK